MKATKKTAAWNDQHREQFIKTLASDFYPDDERRDRAALAALRRGLSGEQRDWVRVYPHVLPRMYGTPLHQHDAYVQTACLFGMHPTPAAVLVRENQTMSLARALRRVWDANDQQGSIQARFMALLQSHRDDLPGHLRQAVSIVASHEHVIHLEWTDVLRALLRWSYPHSSEQRRWANDFWGASEPQDEKENRNED